MSGNVNSSDISVFSGIEHGDISTIFSNHLTVISFLIATSSFVLGLYKSRPVAHRDKRLFQGLILSLVLPSAALTGYGIAMVVSFSVYSSHLPPFIAVIVPIIAILLLMW